MFPLCSLARKGGCTLALPPPQGAYVRRMPPAEPLAGRLEGSDLPCELNLSDERWTLKIVEFDVTTRHGLGDERPADPTVVRLASGSRVATLTQTYPLGFKSQIGRERSFVERRIGANKVFIGPRAVTDNELYNGFSFSPTNELISLFYRAHRGHVRLQHEGTFRSHDLFAQSIAWGPVVSDSIDTSRLEIGTIEAGNLQIALRSTVTETGTIQGTVSVERRYVRGCYTEPVAIGVLLQDVAAILDFLTFVTGEVISPQEFSVLSGDEDQFGSRPAFDLHLRFREPGAELKPEDAVRCLMSQPIDGDRYINSFQMWMMRSADWRTSYSFGSECLAHKNNYGRHRLLDAIGWFESIPTFYLDNQPVVPQGVIDKSVDATKSLLDSEGIDITCDRLASLFAQLNSASLTTRLRSALSYISRRFGLTALPANSSRLVRAITVLRGQFAHGIDVRESNSRYGIVELVTLTESICRYLTLAGLEWELSRLDSAHWHPFQNARFQLFERDRARHAA